MSISEGEGHGETSFRDVLNRIRDGAPALVVILALGVLAAAAVTVRQPREYAAVATAVTSPANGFLDPQAADNLPGITDTIVAVVGTPAVVSPAVEAVAGRMSGEGGSLAGGTGTVDAHWVRTHISATRTTGSLLQITARARTQEDAVRLARAVAVSVGSLVDGGPRSGLPSAGVSSAGVVLRFVTNGEPRGLVSPTPIRNVLIGGDAGLILGLLAAFALGSARRKIRTSRDLATATGLPALETVRKRRVSRGPEIDTGIDTILVKLRSQRSRGQGPIVLVTGPSPVANAFLTRALGSSSERAGAWANVRTVLTSGDRLRSEPTASVVPVVMRMRTLIAHGASSESDSGSGSSGSNGNHHASSNGGGDATESVFGLLADNNLRARLEEVARDRTLVLIQGPPSSKLVELMLALQLCDMAIFVAAKRMSQDAVSAVRSLDSPLLSKFIGAAVLER